MESSYVPNPLQPNGMGGVYPDSDIQVPFHTHDGINSPVITGGGGGDRGVQCILFNFNRGIVTGDGKMYIHIDERLANLSLKDVHAEVVTAGTTGTLDIQIANVNNGTDMLSTKLTIDSGETGSDTAATPAIINSVNAGVALNDVLRIDIDAVQSTAPQGLIVTLGVG